MIIFHYISHTGTQWRAQGGGGGRASSIGSSAPFFTWSPNFLGTRAENENPFGSSNPALSPGNILRTPLRRYSYLFLSFPS